MSGRDDISIAGGWLGTYAYQGAHSWQPPMRFEATFAVGDGGRITGTILDDGPPGEADVNGTQTGRQVQFVKVYRMADPYYEIAPIQYEGTLSDDGRQMTGTWTVNYSRLRMHGVWEAHRRWMTDQEALPETTETTGELELVSGGGQRR